MATPPTPSGSPYPSLTYPVLPEFLATSTAAAAANAQSNSAISMPAAAASATQNSSISQLFQHSHSTSSPAAVSYKRPSPSKSLYPMKAVKTELANVPFRQPSFDEDEEVNSDAPQMASVEESAKKCTELTSRVYYRGKRLDSLFASGAAQFTDATSSCSSASNSPRTETAATTKEQEATIARDITPKYRELEFRLVSINPDIYSVNILGRQRFVRLLNDKKMGNFQDIYKFVFTTDTVIINGKVVDLSRTILKVPKSSEELSKETSTYSHGLKSKEAVLKDACNDLVVGINDLTNAIVENPELNIRMPEYHINPKTRVNENWEIDPKGKYYATFSLVDEMARPVSTSGWSGTRAKDTVSQVFVRSADDKKFLEWAKAILTKSANLGRDVISDFRPRNAMWDASGELNQVDPEQREDDLVLLPGYIRDIADGSRNMADWLIDKFPSDLEAVYREIFNDWEKQNDGNFPAAQGPQVAKHITEQLSAEQDDKYNSFFSTPSPTASAASTPSAASSSSSSASVGKTPSPPPVEADSPITPPPQTPPKVSPRTPPQTPPQMSLTAPKKAASASYKDTFFEVTLPAYLTEDS